MNYTPIIGTLGYILSDDKTHVLMVHRTFRRGDDHLGKYNGLGGHMKPHEDVSRCMIREIYEESGLMASAMTLRGTINWRGFGQNQDDWLGFIFRIDAYQGDVLKENDEGTLYWIPLAHLHDYPMWDGDRLFLPMVFDDKPSPFYGYMEYKGPRVVSWSYTRL